MNQSSRQDGARGWHQLPTLRCVCEHSSVVCTPVCPLLTNCTMCIELLTSNGMYANSLSASMYVRRLVYPTQPSNSVATTHPYFRCGDNCQVTPGSLGEIQYPIPPATHADSDGELARSGFTQLSPQQRLYQERAVTAVKMPEGFRAQTAEDYRQGLTAARAIAERSHCPKHAGLVAEWTARFVVFLAGVPPPYGLQNTRTATPEDVLNFCTMYAMVHHGITKLGDGSVVPAFSTMKGILSNIRHTFDVLGRRGEWQPLTLSGNPCDSTEIREFRTGYEATDSVDRGSRACRCYSRHRENRTCIGGRGGQAAQCTGRYAG
jgi:hypothetical protein